MTQFTSFVAVEEKTVTEGGAPRRVEVPVEMPEGMSYEGVFGKDTQQIAMAAPLQARTFMAGGMLAESRVKSQVAAAPPISKVDAQIGRGDPACKDWRTSGRRRSPVRLRGTGIHTGNPE